MVNRNSIIAYQGPALMRGEGYVYLSPHSLLRPFLSAYTVSFVSGGVMPWEYTILPSASATLVFSVGEGAMTCGLRGVNTKACVVGEHANRYHMLLLIEFHPGGLYPFLRESQAGMADRGFDFASMDASLSRQIEEALLAEQTIGGLNARLDDIFLSRLEGLSPSPVLMQAMGLIVAGGGAVGNRALTEAVFYSEKHLQRLFRQQVGVGIKTFSRIVRVNRALRLLERSPLGLASIAAETGYFDQAHFTREFQSVCGTSPTRYRQNKSVFYNETFKL